MDRCKSCGMLMLKPSQHAGGKPFSKYCKHCADSEGRLKSREEVRKNWIKFAVESQGLPKKKAEKIVSEQMPKMPAWKE